MNNATTATETSIMSYRGPLAVRTECDEAPPYRVLVGYRLDGVFYILDESWCRSPEGAAAVHAVLVERYSAALDYDGRPVTAPETEWHVAA